MNNKLVRLISLLLALVLSLVLFSACSPSEDKTPSSGEPSTVQTEVDDDLDQDSDDRDSDEDLDEEDEELYDEDWDDEDWDDQDYEDEYYDEDLDYEEEYIEEEDEDDYDETYNSSITVYNSTPVQSDFMGFNAVYHAFAYRSDEWGRQYDEATAKFETQRAINTGMNVARTHYDHNLAWDSVKKEWNWESEDMQALYKWCLDLKAGGVDVLINYWYHNNYLFQSYHWSDETADGVANECFEGFLVAGDQQKTLQKFADFMADTVNALRAHGCTNATQLSVATEPGSWWNTNWGEEDGEEFKAYQAKCAKSQADTVNTLSRTLKSRDMRQFVKIMGPNVAGDANRTGLYTKYFKGYVDEDAVDYISIHTYHGADLTADNYYMWQEKWDELTTYGIESENYIWDEYNLANLGGGDTTQSIRNSPYAGTQMALAKVCFLNNGFKGSYRWSLFDQQWPNNYTTNAGDNFDDGVHMCGTAPTLLRSSVVYPTYYSYSLVQTLMGVEHSKVYASSNDEVYGIYSAMTVTPDGNINIMVVSSSIDTVNLTLDFEKSLGGVTLYRHTYDPNDLAPCTAEAELIGPDLKITNTSETLKDVIKPYNVVIYTTQKIS